MTYAVNTRVQTTESWTATYLWNRRASLVGVVVAVVEAGPMPCSPMRTTLVRLDEPLGVWRSFWFDPADLEPYCQPDERKPL